MIVTNDLKSTSSTLLRQGEELDTKIVNNVNHPSHYNQGNVECIDALDACGFGLDFCVGNAIKYLWRFKDKDKPVEDLKKALWYLTHALSKIEEGVYKP